MVKVTKRNIGVEYLRIVCMLWIILHHFSSIVINEILHSNEIGINYYISVLDFIGGDIGNVVFILITGFYMHDKTFDIVRWVKLFLQVLFYSVLSYTIMIVLGRIELNWQNLAHMLFPIRQNNYWFISTYLILFFSFPILNLVIEKTAKRLLLFVIVLGLIIFSFLPSLGYSWLASDTNCFMMFIILYLFGGWMGYHKINIWKRNKLIICVLFIVTLTGTVLSAPLFQKYGNYAFRFIWGMRAPIIIISFCLFEIFRNVNLKYNRFLVNSAKCVFGVYLLHNGPLLPEIERMFGINQASYYFSGWGGDYYCQQ